MVLVRKEVLLEDWQLAIFKDMGEEIGPLVRTLVSEYLENKKTNYNKELKDAEEKLIKIKKAQEEDIKLFLEDFTMTIKQANSPNSGVSINQNDYLNKMSSIYANKKGIAVALAKEKLDDLVKDIMGDTNGK